MDSEPLFSVMIANYNHACFIDDAIQSVFNQTYTNWEIVIVDDCSTDNSLDVIAKYKKNDRIQVLINEKNSGCGYTKRKCVENAHGMYCGFLDADDSLLPNALSDMVRCHREKPEVSVVFSRYVLCDENWNQLGESRRLNLPLGESYYINGDYAPEHFVSFKKNMYLQTEGINPLYPMAEDQDLFYKLEEIGPCFVMDKFTYRYRHFSNSTSHSDSLAAPFWNTLASYEACKRRGISIFDYCYTPWKEYVDDHKGYNSLAYKLGYSILRPFVIIKNLFR